MKRKRLINHSKTNLPLVNKKRFSIKDFFIIFTKFSLFFKGFLNLIVFIVIITTYVFHQCFNWLINRRLIPSFLKNKLNPPLNKIYDKIMSVIDPEKPRSFNRSYLIELSLNNMKAKKARTIVTMGGMAIGIAFIVFLVSIGYGLQNLVVSRVARLDELRQADAVPGLSDNLVLNDETLSKFKNIQNVELTLPLIAVVGKISYQQSVSDMAVYGVTTSYLKNSAIQPIKGKIFDDGDQISVKQPGQVAGVSTDIKKSNVENEFRQVDYEIKPSIWLKVRENASSKAKLIGYTRKTEGVQSGIETTGESYLNYEDILVNKWIKTTVPLWQKIDCSIDQNSSCEDGNYLPIINSQDGQEQKEGYVAELSMKITSDETSKTDVLGINTEIKSSGSLPMINIASESAIPEEQQNKIVEVNSEAKKVAVINRSALQMLNIDENSAVGKKISLSFVVVGDLMTDQKGKIESTFVDYSIIGVISDNDTPMIYVPFIDLRSLGITNFSQIKIIVSDTNSLSKVRSTIEASGYGTISVVDTVAQIDKLFISFRLILAILGMVALIVAALGMFNTLTVSLMERTREVGLMKAMGMKSSEVKELFLTESMIMGFFGGIIGLIAGSLIGKFFGLILTTFSLVKGGSVVNISYVPPIFVITILLLSVIVGILTGYFPARRATKISALNALRYE